MQNPAQETLTKLTLLLLHWRSFQLLNPPKHLPAGSTLAQAPQSQPSQPRHAI